MNRSKDRKELSIDDLPWPLWIPLFAVACLIWFVLRAIGRLIDGPDTASRRTKR